MAVRPVALKKPQAASETDSQLFDTHPELRLEFRHVREALKQGYDRPFLLIDTEIVRNKVRRFKSALPRVHPHYAVKANPDPRVLKVLIEEGAGFEIASIAELDVLPAGRGLVVERGGRQQLAGRRPQVADVGAGVAELLVEAQMGDEAVVGRLEAHADLEGVVDLRVAERGVGAEDGARAGRRAGERPGAVGGHHVAGGVH